MEGFQPGPVSILGVVALPLPSLNMLTISLVYGTVSGNSQHRQLTFSGPLCSAPENGADRQQQGGGSYEGGL